MRNLLKESIGASLKKFSFPVWIAGSFAAGVAGPFGTHAIASFWERWLYWALIIVVSIFMAGFLRRLSHRLSGPDKPLLEDVLMIGLMTVSFTPALLFLTKLVSDRGEYPTVLELGLYVAIVSLVISATRRVLSVTATDTGAISREAPGHLPRIMRRLPKSCGGSIIRLNVSDHRVRVVTTDGEYSLRLRFGDAIDEMDPVDGFCTHRSHWVARQAVHGPERENGKTYLRLVNGDRVPVSRTYQRDLEAAGLL